MFPQIDTIKQNIIERCVTCQAVGRPNAAEPIVTTIMPKHPWRVVHVDFYGPLPSNEYLLVVIDRYSRFPDVEIVHSTKASVVIPKLDKIFVVHWIPKIMKSDNGPPFNGEEYKRYLNALGIKPEFYTPLWPQGNSAVERFMRPLGKALKTAKIEGRPWKQELNRFLLQYRTTPHATTGVPSAELIFNRKVQGTLPVLQKKNVVNRHKEARANEEKRQKYNKMYVNDRRNAKKSGIKVGDYVLVKQEKKNKLTANFNQTPYVVVYRNKTVVRAKNKHGHIIERNVSYFKRIPKPYNEEHNTDDADDLDDNFNNRNPATPRVNANEENGNNADIGLRRSTRTRRQPERYGQTLPSNIVT